ncbi:hypothetical protein KIPB_005609 [Kipferlia bialata]|uniref:Uncharacterized protein n=1 Tax=Kipferlia bialata TaxID=797122 RepID=A0A9K3GJ20_9EUKA|nr:hypothetical protein KIPB_003090 [Kipferlia bialata]GIQ84165.1 hypothetical protein KIPB_005609 [Kipferlia bialata]|eukprot:g3090.t1
MFAHTLHPSLSPKSVAGSVSPYEEDTLTDDAARLVALTALYHARMEEGEWDGAAAVYRQVTSLVHRLREEVRVSAAQSMDEHQEKVLRSLSKAEATRHRVLGIRAKRAGERSEHMCTAHNRALSVRYHRLCRHIACLDKQGVSSRRQAATQRQGCADLCKEFRRRSVHMRRLCRVRRDVLNGLATRDRQSESAARARTQHVLASQRYMRGAGDQHAITRAVGGGIGEGHMDRSAVVSRQMSRQRSMRVGRADAPEALSITVGPIAIEHGGGGGGTPGPMALPSIPNVLVHSPSLSPTVSGATSPSVSRMSGGQPPLGPTTAARSSSVLGQHNGMSALALALRRPERLHPVISTAPLGSSPDVPEAEARHNLLRDMGQTTASEAPGQPGKRAQTLAGRHRVASHVRRRVPSPPVSLTVRPHTTAGLAKHLLVRRGEADVPRLTQTGIYGDSAGADAEVAEYASSIVAGIVAEGVAAVQQEGSASHAVCEWVVHECVSDAVDSTEADIQRQMQGIRGLSSRSALLANVRPLVKGVGSMGEEEASTTLSACLSLDTLPPPVDGSALPPPAPVSRGASQGGSRVGSRSGLRRSHSAVAYGRGRSHNK